MEFITYNLKNGKFNKIIIELTEDNHILVREKIKNHIKYIIDTFKKLKKAGIIKSLAKPKNKKIQKDLEELIMIKSKLKKDIEKINILFN
jgi:hypothetical protein